jgi:uncharacterized membrane protein
MLSLVYTLMKILCYSIIISNAIGTLSNLHYWNLSISVFFESRYHVVDEIGIENIAITA